MNRGYNISVSSDSPLPQILVILGFIAIFLFAIPLKLAGISDLAFFSAFFGFILIVIGILFWLLFRA